MKNFLISVFFIIATSISAQNKVISFTAVGDIMMGTTYPKDKLPPEDGRNLMINVEHILKSTDYTFGNLESVLINEGEPKKECDDTTACCFFKTPTHYVKNLVDAGFNILSLGNNHAYDFGSEGYDTTSYYLNKNNIYHAGKDSSYVIWKKDSIKFGFIAFAPNAGCQNLLDSLIVTKQIRYLADSTDILIVSFHGGAEGENALHIADSMEVYYGENRGNVLRFARSAIDVGADIVLGHGPHVPRAIELYNDRLIAYSLGNFCTYKGFSLLESKGLAPILQFKVNKKGVFLEGEIISARQLRSKGTIPDKYNRAFKLMTKLTLEDIDSTNIKFFNNASLLSFR